jgi:hypothetical protein
MIDHHEMSYKSVVSEKSKLQLNCQIYTVEEYSDYFISCLKEPKGKDSTLHYCYSFDDSVSAAKMVYVIGRAVLDHFHIKDDTVFEEGTTMEQIIDIVSDYDIGQYKLPG